MNFRFSGEARARRQFAGQQISQIRELLSEHPGAIPALYPGYDEEVGQIADRLYVPNIEVKGGAVYATTPRAYRTKNAIGVIATHSGEPIVMDRWLVQASERQKEQQRRFFATHTTMHTSIGMQKIHDSVQDGATSSLTSDTIAGSWNYAYRVGSEPFFHKKTAQPIFAAINYMSPLAVNMDLPQDLATSMHEVHHLVEMDGTGVGSDDYIDNRAVLMVSEQQGYHVGRVVGDYMVDHGLPTPPHMLEQLSNAHRIDAVRATQLGEDQFGFSHELAKAYHEAGLLDFMLTPDYQRGLRLQ